MESKIVHEQLNKRDHTEARDVLICYLQYLMDYRRDVPDIDEHVIHELQSLPSTQYAQSLQEDDPIYRIIHLAKALEIDENERNEATWKKLHLYIGNLHLS